MVPVYAAEIEDGLDVEELAEGRLAVASAPLPVPVAAGDYSHINFVPPAGAKKAAKQGLAQRREFKRGGTAVGVARARDIARGARLSPSTVRRMVSFFARHEVDKKGKGWAPGDDGFPSNGRIAWNLWGGDPGWAWAKKVVRQMEAADADAHLLSSSAGEAPAVPPGLFAFKSVLAQTGFNNNADYFPAADMWAARGSIVHQLLNLNHDKDDVLGHQTAYAVVDADLAPVPEDGDPPAAFAVYDTSVIYTLRGSKEKNAQVEKICEEILAGGWWVSMEATMSDFDYVVADMPASGRPADADPATVKVIKRSEATAKLTKYLRQYKNKAGKRGPGVLPDGRLIGRVLRAFTFTGKGLVRRPANPTSAVYTLDDKPLSGAAAVSAGYTLPTEEGLMNDTDKLVAAEKRVTELEAALAVEKELVTQAKAAVADKDAQLAALAKDLGDAKAALDQVALEKRQVELAAKVKAAYKTADDAKALALAKNLSKLADDAVQAHLDDVAALMAPPAAPKAETAVADLAPTDAPKPTDPPAPKPTKLDQIKAEAAKLSTYIKKGNK